MKKIKQFGEGNGFIWVGLTQDVGAFALAGDHQSLGDELPDGITCGHHRDAVPRGQLGEGRELVTGMVGAGGDRTAQVVSDALVGRSGIGMVHLHGPTVPYELAET